MNVGLLTDLHFGLKKNNKIVLNWLIKSLDQAKNSFMKHNCKTIIICGDIFDNRELNSTYMMKEFLNWFESFSKEFERIYIIIGNHDIFYKNTREYNIIDILLGTHEKVCIVNSPMVVDNMILMPWIVDPEEIKFIGDKKQNILIGHYEINGFKFVTSGMVCTHGLKQDLFSKFDLVLSGHFHVKQNQDNIHYLGTIMPLTRGELGESHGWHILDTENLELKFFENEISMFETFEINSSTKKIPNFEDKFVKVIVEGEYTKSIEKALSEIQSTAVECSIIKDKYITDAENKDKSSQINLENYSIEEILDEYLSQHLSESLDKEIFKKLFNKIYNQVMNEG
jgi:DNA repair exonuclease SbcCD nuclease subunit